MKTKEIILKSWLVALLELTILPLGIFLILFACDLVFPKYGGTDSGPISPGVIEGIICALLWIALWFIGIISSIILGRNVLVVSSAKKSLLIAALLIIIPFAITFLLMIQHN